MAESVNKAELERRRRKREMEEAANKSGAARKDRTNDALRGSPSQSKDPGSRGMADRQPRPRAQPTPRVSTESSGVTAGSIPSGIKDTSAANNRPRTPPASQSQPGDRPAAPKRDAWQTAFDSARRSGVYGGGRQQGPTAPPGGEMAANRRSGDTASPSFQSAKPPTRPAGGGISGKPGGASGSGGGSRGAGAVASSPMPGSKPGTKATAGTGGPRRGGYRAGQGESGFSKGQVKVKQPYGPDATYKNKTQDQAKRLEKMLSKQGK